MGVMQILSSSSSCSMEEVAATGPGVRFFQLYVSWKSPVTENLSTWLSQNAEREDTFKTSLHNANQRMWVRESIPICPDLYKMWYSPTGTLHSLLKMILITKTELQHICMWHHWSCSDTGYRSGPGLLFTLLGPVCDPVVWQFLWQASNVSFVKFFERTGLQGQTHHHAIGASGRGCRLQCNSADGGYTTTWPQRSRPQE